jgi:hypothetical protein
VDQYGWKSGRSNNFGVDQRVTYLAAVKRLIQHHRHTNTTDIWGSLFTLRLWSPTCGATYLNRQVPNSTAPHLRKRLSCILTVVTATDRTRLQRLSSDRNEHTSNFLSIMKVTNKMQSYRLIYYSYQRYMLRAMFSPIIRSTWLYLQYLVQST